MSKTCLILGSFLMCLDLAWATKKPALIPRYQAGEMLIKLRGDRTQTKIMQWLNLKIGKNTVQKIQALKTDQRLQKLKLFRDSDFKKVMELLKKSPWVEYAEPNYLYKALEGEPPEVPPEVPPEIPNDTDFQKLWGLHNTGQPDFSGQVGFPGADISILPLWKKGVTGSKGVIVAVIDTGVEWDHTDLVDNVYTNPIESGANAVNGKDDDGNGFIDDVHGWNFAAHTNNSKDDHGHGTHVSGTIGAMGNNGLGVVGVNWQVSILPVKFLTSSGSGTLTDAIEAINYARIMGAKIMSNSWGGGGFSQAMQDAILSAKNAGVLFIAAAGNDGSDNDALPSYPASYPLDNVISVAATDNQDKLASFSNYGARTVHLAAPGVRIYSTVKDGGYTQMSGTSMATPHVSGIAALLWAANPEWTFEDLKLRMIKTSTPIHILRKKVLAHGRVSASNAYYNIIPPTDEPNEVDWISEAQSIESPHPYGNNQDLTWTIQKTGVKYLRVFFEKVNTEKTYDKVFIEDSLGGVGDELSGNYSDYTSDYVKGEVLKIRLKTDLSVTDYGFKVSKIQYIPK